VKLPEQPSLEDLKRLALGLVVLIEQTDRMLRFRVRDPGAYATFDLVFHDPTGFVGDLKMDDAACVSLLQLRVRSRTFITAGTNSLVMRSCRPTVGPTKFRSCLLAARKPCLVLALPT